MTCTEKGTKMTEKDLMIQELRRENAELRARMPVVRCKDCKYRFKNNGHSKDGCPIIDANIWMDDDDFCSHGERKEGAD